MFVFFKMTDISAFISPIILFCAVCFLCLAVCVFLSPFVCHCHCKSPHFVQIQWVKGLSTVSCQSVLKTDSAALSVSTYVFSVCVSRVFSSLALHMSISSPRLPNNTRGSNANAGFRDCWLVTVIPSSHFWCKWGEIKGYHLSANALRSVSFPALCTTSICKAGFLSIRPHEYIYFLLVKPWKEFVFCFLELLYEYFLLFIRQPQQSTC